jgi:hypothetical protein
VRLEKLGNRKIDLIGTRTHDLPTCNIVPQPTTLPRAISTLYTCKFLQRRDIKYKNARNEKAIEMDPMKMCSEDRRWIELAQDRVQLWALVMPVLNCYRHVSCMSTGKYSCLCNSNAYQIYCPTGLVRRHQWLADGGVRTLSPHSRFKR